MGSRKISPFLSPWYSLSCQSHPVQVRDRHHPLSFFSLAGLGGIAGSLSECHDCRITTLSRQFTLRIFLMVIEYKTPKNWGLV